MSNKQHSKASWISAGLTALADGEPSTLRAEPLAKQLGTTKGSFYWHFADVPTYRDAVIDSWRNDALNGIVKQLSSNSTPDKRLLAFGEHILNDQVDPAMRIWAKSHAHARSTVIQIDEQRLTYISTLLASFDIANPAFALAAYGTLIGAPSVQTDTTPSQAFTALIDLFLALK
jgi:AcrR family transcriptional regulator